MTDRERLLVEQELVRRELARRSFAEYLAYTQGPLWKRTRLSEYLASKVQSFIETDTGHAFDILIVQCPPQHGKSTSITESLPAWFIGKYPDRRVILTAYNDEYAEKFLRRNKEKIKGLGQNVYDIKPGVVDRATDFEIKGRRGGILSRGLRAGITGNAGDLIIIDDPIKNRQEAYSQTFRDQIWGEWFFSVRTRLSAGAKVIVIATPWHEDDLMSRMILSETNLELIKIPVEAQANDPLGRQMGESLCPELGKDDAWLADFKQAYIKDPTAGPAAWAAMFMCSPRIEGGNIIKRDWWQFYDPNKVTKFGTELISVDASFKGGDDNDCVAITVWGKVGSNYYLRYCLNQQMDFVTTLKNIRLVKQQYPNATRVLIEDKANGSAIINVLQREMFCIPVNPLGGKESRVHAISAAIESGHVFLPEGESWVFQLIDQFSAFPAGAQDDIVDSVSQALNFMIFSNGTTEKPKKTADEMYLEQEQEIFLGGDMYDIYGG